MGTNMWKENALITMLGLLVLLFTACDQTIYHEVYIRNSSSYHLDLIFETSQNDQLDSMKLDTGTEYLIYKYSKYIESADLNYTLNYHYCPVINPINSTGYKSTPLECGCLSV